MNSAPTSSASTASAPRWCTPALVYLVISFVALVMTWLQNHQNTNVYCVGHVSCPVQSTTYVFILKVLWFLFWAWLLNVLCIKGYTTVAWVLVAIPFMVFFTLMFGLANTMVRGSAASLSQLPPPPVSSYAVGIPGTTSYNNGKKPQAKAGEVMVHPNEYVYGNKDDKVAFYPNETNTQYSSYANYDTNVDNRAKFLDRESKGLIHPLQQQQPQQKQPQQQ